MKPAGFCARLLLLAIGGSLVACAPRGLYHWGKYETSLYRYYKHPADQAGLVEALAKVLDKAEAAEKVPPGLYAEYGYLLLEQGETSEASEYFRKEKVAWPESTVLMDTMIRAAQSGKGRGAVSEPVAPATPPAPLSLQ